MKGARRRAHVAAGSTAARSRVATRRARLVSALPLAIAVWLFALGATSQVVTPSIMDVSEIQPGMRGYGLSVFRGTTPERFDIEVIDVLHQFRPDQDLILVRTIHPTLERAHTVGGMSGSPIYIDDRLIGAYAYGWPFGVEPIAGVTPIRNMLRELARTPRPGAFPGARPLSELGGGTSGSTRSRERRPPRLAGLAPYTGDRPRGALAPIEEHAARLGIRPGARRSSASMVPASTPLLVGGMHPEVVESLAIYLEPFGLDVLQVGGAGELSSATSSSARFVDGGALAVTLARGDIANTVIGTVTHVEGDRLIAFGHPMVEAGETGLPTAVARVLHIFASVQRSFKIAEPIAALGTLTEDRQAAIVVDTALAPAMIPVRLRMMGVSDAHRTEWNFEVASHRAVTPLIVSSSVQSAIKSVAGDVDYVSFDAVSRVWIEGMSEPVTLTDRGFSASGAHQASALSQLRTFDLVEAAWANPFEERRVTRIELDVTLRFEHATAEIVDASVPSTTVDAGDDVPVRIVLRPWDGPEFVRIVSVHVPESTAGDSLTILVQPGGDVEIERPEPRAFDDVIEAVRDRYPSTSIVLSTRMPERGLRMSGHVVRALPGSALDALQRTSDSGWARPITTYVRSEVPTDRVLSGAARIDLSVRRIEREEDDEE